MLARIYRSLGDKELAKSYQQEHQAYYAKMQKSLRTSIDQEIDRMEKVRLSLEREKKQQRLFFIAVFLLGVCISTLVIWYMIRTHRKQKARTIAEFQKIIRELKPAGNQSIGESIEAREKELPVRKVADLPEDTSEALLRKLDRFEASEKFTNPNMSLSLLATMLKTNPNYLSETINQHKQMNFNSYINKLRIDYICRKIIHEPKFRTYKISYLAQISGFSSHSRFTKTFRVVTNMPPSDFIAQAVELDHNQTV